MNAVEAASPSAGPTVLAAGGTLVRSPSIETPRLSRTAWLWAELAVLFVGLPMVMSVAVHRMHVPLFVMLQPVLLTIVAVLLFDRGFRLVRELSKPFPIRELFSIVALFLVVGGSVAVFVQQELPDLFLSMPHNNPRLWRLVLVFYPLLSVIPQELVYRTFFFHRYGPLFGDAKWTAVLVNGALFGFAHIIFGTWTSVWMSGLLGCLLAYRYAVTRSFWAVWLEHAMYGDLIFTIGLGVYFFTGVSSISLR